MTFGALADVVEFLLPRGCLVCRQWQPSGSEALVCAACRSRYRSPSWPRCPRCHHPTGSGRIRGAHCLECASWPDALGFARYAYDLRGPASRTVHALKYDGWRRLAREMARAMVAAWADTTPIDLVTHVPTTERRRRLRGYDQAELLGVAVAERLGVPCATILERRGRARSQTALGPVERRHNVSDVFAPVAGAGGAGSKRVLLVDDVLTTGATATAVATALRNDAGCAHVSLLTFARALPRLEARSSRSNVA